MRTRKTTKDFLKSLVAPPDYRQLFRSLAADLLPEASTPYSAVELPPYKTKLSGHVTLTHYDMPMQVGYFTGLHYAKTPVRALRFRNDILGATDSLSIESELPHIEFAHGNVIMTAIGSGVALFNIAKKPEVKTVHVCAPSMMVVNGVKDAIGFHSWSADAKAKIKFVERDSLGRLDDLPTIDHLFVNDTGLDPVIDIDTAQRDHALLGGRYVTFVGQELYYVFWALDKDFDPTHADNWRAMQERIRLPLEYPARLRFEVYAALAQAAFDGLIKP